MILVLIGISFQSYMAGRSSHTPCPTRKMVPITGRARSFLLFSEFSKIKQRGGGDRKKKTAYQFTQGYNILHRLQVHHPILTFVSLLKAWNVTVVWIVCNDAVFNATSRRYTPQIVSSGKNLNSASKVANWIIVDILKYLY